MCLNNISASFIILNKAKCSEIVGNCVRISKLIEFETFCFWAVTQEEFSFYKPESFGWVLKLLSAAGWVFFFKEILWEWVWYKSYVYFIVRDLSFSAITCLFVQIYVRNYVCSVLVRNCYLKLTPAEFCLNVLSECRIKLI